MRNCGVATRIHTNIDAVISVIALCVLIVTLFVITNSHTSIDIVNSKKIEKNYTLTSLCFYVNTQHVRNLREREATMPRSKAARPLKRHRKFIGGGRRRRRRKCHVIPLFSAMGQVGKTAPPLIKAVKKAKAMYDAPFGLFKK